MKFAHSWSQDGRYIAFSESGEKNRLGYLDPAHVRRLQADSFSTDVVQRAAARLFARRAVARLPVQRVGPRGDLRSALSRPGRQMADLERGRSRAGLARRRQGDLLRRPRTEAHGGRHQSGRKLPGGRSSSALSSQSPADHRRPQPLSADSRRPALSLARPPRARVSRPDHSGSELERRARALTVAAFSAAVAARPALRELTTGAGPGSRLTVTHGRGPCLLGATVTEGGDKPLPYETLGRSSLPRQNAPLCPQRDQFREVHRAKRLALRERTRRRWTRLAARPVAEPRAGGAARSSAQRARRFTAAGERYGCTALALSTPPDIAFWRPRRRPSPR